MFASLQLQPQARINTVKYDFDGIINQIWVQKKKKKQIRM